MDASRAKHQAHQTALEKELGEAKSECAAAQGELSTEKQAHSVVKKELQTVQKAFGEAQQCLQGKLSKLQQAFADENKKLRQQLADATHKAEEASQGQDPNESTASNEVQELEVLPHPLSCFWGTL